MNDIDPGIKETGELLSFVAGLIHDGLEAYQKDGEIGFWDVTTLGLANFSKGRAAFRDIGKVWPELRAIFILNDDAQLLKLDALYWLVIESLQLKEHEFSRKVFNAHFAYLRVTIEHIRLVKRLTGPPVPRIIEEEIGDATFPS